MLSVREPRVSETRFPRTSFSGSSRPFAPILEVNSTGADLYSPSCLEEVFSETQLQDDQVAGRERIFMRRCIEVPTPKVRDRSERALSRGG